MMTEENQTSQAKSTRARAIEVFSIVASSPTFTESSHQLYSLNKVFISTSRRQRRDASTADGRC
jgi:hypothetical protein